MMNDENILDVVVSGGGPAGVSCAVWLARLGFSPVLLEATDQIGGLCRDHPFMDDWNATLPDMTGPQVALNLARSLQQAKVDTRLSHPISKIESDGSGWQVFIDGHSGSLRARHLVLATGVRARGLPQWPDSRTLPDGVLVGPGAAIVAQDFSGKRVAVLGGGDNAFENALYALKHGAQEVVIFARHVRAQHQFVDQFPADKIVLGACRVNVAQRHVNDLPWDLILVFYGWEARVPKVSGQTLRWTPHGFLDTEPATAQTSAPGLYAIGEVAQRMHPCVVTALADGVTAAKAIQARLEATDDEPASEPSVWHP